MENQEIFNQKTKKSMHVQFNHHFRQNPSSEDLNKTLETILKNQDLFLYFAAFIPEDQALMMGSYSYFPDDQSSIRVQYGIIADLKHLPRTLRLLTHEQTIGLIVPSKITLSDNFPDYSRYGYEVKGMPTSESLLESINSALQEPEKYLRDIEF